MSVFQGASAKIQIKSGLVEEVPKWSGDGVNLDFEIATIEFNSKMINGYKR